MNLYLAAAAKDNAEGRTGEALVIATEIDLAKAAAARTNLEQAGLARPMRRSARAILGKAWEDLTGPIDFALLDIWAPLARPAIELLAPRLRSGAIVACDNIERLKREYRDYLAYIEDSANGFDCLTLPMRGRFGLAVRL